MGYQEQYDQAKAAGELHQMEPSMLKFEEGMLIIGEFVERTLVESKDKKMENSYRYLFESDDGPISFFVSGAFDKRQGTQLEVGVVYAIEYKEKRDIGGGRTFKDIRTYPLGKPVGNSKGVGKVDMEVSL